MVDPHGVALEKFEEKSPQPSGGKCGYNHPNRPLIDSPLEGSARNMAPPIVVLDVETTGFGKFDRITEIALLTLDPATLEVIEEYDTLVNPQRDISSEITDFTGIAPSLVALAPVFADIAVAVSARLHGSVIVAHNAPFDCRFIKQEFVRCKGAFDPGVPVCTLSAFGRRKLGAVCAEQHIPLVNAHRALADARAVASLCQKMGEDGPIASGSAARCSPPPALALKVRTLRRDAVSDTDHLPRKTGSPWRDPELCYRYEVNAALDDNEITEMEWEALEALAQRLGLSKAEQAKQHEILYGRIEESARRNGVLLDADIQYLEGIATALDLTIEPMERTKEGQVDWDRIERVCFTGDSGSGPSRAELEGIAQSVGQSPQRNVTMKLDALVAWDITTMSGKARKARQYGVPVIETEDYLARFEGD